MTLQVEHNWLSEGLCALTVSFEPSKAIALSQQMVEGFRDKALTVAGEVAASANKAKAKQQASDLKTARAKLAGVEKRITEAKAAAKAAMAAGEDPAPSEAELRQARADEEIFGNRVETLEGL